MAEPAAGARHVYETKTARWAQQWPELTAVPWDNRAGL
jgi:hypothetical protein